VECVSCPSYESSFCHRVPPDQAPVLAAMTEVKTRAGLTGGQGGAGVTCSDKFQSGQLLSSSQHRNLPSTHSSTDGQILKLWKRCNSSHQCLLGTIINPMRGPLVNLQRFKQTQSWRIRDGVLHGPMYTPPFDEAHLIGAILPDDRLQPYLKRSPSCRALQCATNNITCRMPQNGQVLTPCGCS
jgi:hypothetical protein